MIFLNLKIGQIKKCCYRDYKNPENEDEAGEDEDDKEYKPETDRQPARRQTATRGTGRRPGEAHCHKSHVRTTPVWYYGMVLSFHHIDASSL